MLIRWLDGDIRGLWAESKAKMNHQRNKTPMQGTKDIQKRNIERAILMAKEGNSWQGHSMPSIIGNGGKMAVRFIN